MEEKVQVVKLFPKDTSKLEVFCSKCAQEGYLNNRDLSSIKWGHVYDLPSMAEYWALQINDSIVSLSGCHSFDESHKILRCLFRSVTLSEYSNLITGLSKNHMNSIPFSLLLSEQIQYGLENGYQKFWLTTVEKDFDASGKMFRTHKAMVLLAKRNIVDYVGVKKYYDTNQTIWQINVSNYSKAQKAFLNSQKDNFLK